jgi:hypothetical protein
MHTICKPWSVTQLTQNALWILTEKSRGILTIKTPSTPKGSCSNDEILGFELRLVTLKKNLGKTLSSYFRQQFFCLFVCVWNSLWRMLRPWFRKSSPIRSYKYSESVSDKWLRIATCRPAVISAATDDKYRDNDIFTFVGVRVLLC